MYCALTLKSESEAIKSSNSLVACDVYWCVWCCGGAAARFGEYESFCCTTRSSMEPTVNWVNTQLDKYQLEYMA